MLRGLRRCLQGSWPRAGAGGKALWLLPRPQASRSASSALACELAACELTVGEFAGPRAEARRAALRGSLSGSLSPEARADDPGDPGDPGFLPSFAAPAEVSLRIAGEAPVGARFTRTCASSPLSELPSACRDNGGFFRPGRTASLALPVRFDLPLIEVLASI